MTQKITMGGRPERLFAYLIDAIILVVPALLIAGLMAGTDAEQKPVVNPASLLIIFLCNAAYYTLFHSGGWQATPGKRLMGIYVMRTDHARLSARDALERYLAYILPSLPLQLSFLSQEVASMVVIMLSIFWFMPILNTPSRAAIHDKLCNTRVVTGRL